MDTNTFYALFSATCFTLLGLWWGVVQRHQEWMVDTRLRGIVGGVYVSFLLPALMGLFAQVGGTETPVVWRVSFVVIAIIGLVSTVRLLRSQRGAPVVQGPLMRNRWLVAVIYGLVAVVGAAPEITGPIGITPIQTEAILLILLILVAHGLVWEFMIGAAKTRPAREDDATSQR